MKKRTFLKTSSTLLAGMALTPMWSCQPSRQPRKNWAGNYEYLANHLHQPASLEQVRDKVRSLPSLRALGTRHCFNDIADHREDQLSVQLLDKVISIDRDAMTITAEAGMSYGQLCPYLMEQGYALHNLASLPHISIAGACSTATHGSGVHNGNLSTAVVALEIVTAGGDLLTIAKENDGDKFNGAVVGLGGLGIITKVTLQIQEAFKVRQDVYENLAMTQLQEHFDEIMSHGYSVSLFTDWQNPLINQVWIKRRTEDGQPAPPLFFGAKLATKNMHPIAAMSAENCTEQMGVPGPWQERLPHFRMGFTPSSGEELQAEYFVPRRQAVEAILAINKLAGQVGPVLMISEIRTIAADELWMSPCYKQDSVSIHFTLKQDKKAVEDLLPVIERELAPFGVRPHWGKLFSVPPGVLQSRYPRMEDFRALLTEYDPNGKFRNDYLERNIFAPVVR